jgi:DNA-binding MarR family transcriptional regulator
VQAGKGVSKLKGDPMKEEPKGSLYYVIPGEVMHDKSLSIEEKFLYSLISGLSDTYGYCFASNVWFEQKMDIKEKTLQRNLKTLEEKGYILREMVPSENNPLKRERRIYVLASFKKCLRGVKNDDTEPVKTGTFEASKRGHILSEEKILISKDKKKEINKERSAAPPPSAGAESLFDFFLQKIRERNPNHKEPNRKKWVEEFDRILRIDKRPLDECTEVILWASGHPFWQANCLSPSNLRKSYDRMVMQKNSSKDLIKNSVKQEDDNDPVKAFNQTPKAVRILTRAEINQQWLDKFMLQDEFRKRLVRDWKARSMPKYVEFVGLPEGKVYFDQEAPVFQACIQSFIEKLKP